MIKATAQPKLRRSLKPLEVMFLALSAASPAASVYLFGGGIIQIGGSGAILAIAIGAPIAALLGLLFGEVAAAFPEAGGAYPAGGSRRPHRSQYHRPVPGGRTAGPGRGHRLRLPDALARRLGQCRPSLPGRPRA